MRLFILPNLYCLVIAHSNGWNGRPYFSHWPPCFGYVVCLCYSRKALRTTLEKSDAQNITARENQSEQHELSYQWEPIKKLFLKKNDTEWWKKTKKLTGKQVLKKYFTSYKIRYKYLRKTIVKPFDYWEIATTTCSN